MKVISGAFAFLCLIISWVYLFKFENTRAGIWFMGLALFNLTIAMHV
jgi:hypothetical protein